MKATKKIVGAASALVVAVALSAGSTFAWFSSSGSVKAEGMEITAQASGNLVICTEYSGTYTNAVNLAAEAGHEHAAVVPVSTVGNATITGEPENATSNPNFYKIGQAGAGMTPQDSDYADSKFVVATADDYIKYTVYVMSIGEGISGIYADIDVVSQQSNTELDKSLRVMLVTTEMSNIYAPVAGGQTTYEGIESVSDGTPTTGEVTCATEGADGTSVIENLTADTKYQIDIYIWYEGQDESCKATNAVNVSETTLSLTLTKKSA